MTKTALTSLLPILVLSLFRSSQAQNPGQLFHEMPPIPEAVTNNAVTAAKVNGTMYVYSFMGMDSTKIWSGIHLKAWRLNMITEEWEALPPVPDPSGGLIAGAASTVKNKIYVIGGYHVAQNGTETSSNKVHRFDPQTNAWLSDGANLPIAIDDHVQAVWRDSLIFVVTGWSNSSNVPNVQIYNPTTDSWATGTSVPNNSDFKVFGASGTIKGDTLFYCGGARDGSNFPATAVFRIGRINPNDPTQITWFSENNTVAKGYRMAAATVAGGVVWLGGSDVTYNYNGIAYNGSGGVPALTRAKTYYQGILSEVNNPDVFPAIMDLRGAAQTDADNFVTVGGMETDQKVSNKVYGFSWAFTVAGKEPLHKPGFKFSPNPVTDILQIESTQPGLFKLVNQDGTIIRQVDGSGIIQMATSDLPAGFYFLQFWENGKLAGIENLVIVRF